MKEIREFEAANEQEAVRAAALEVGVSEQDLEYEVTDPGSKGILGVGGRPARILVTLPQSPPPEESRSSIGEDIREFQSALVRRMHLDITVGVEISDEYIDVKLSGRDRDLVLQSRAELLEAFQYLLNRIFSKSAKGARIQVDCEGFRKRKEEELKQIAQRIAERVRLTGQREELGLMNPYERRIVHLAVATEQGVTSESVGNGFMKRITILPT